MTEQIDIFTFLKQEKERAKTRVESDPETPKNARPCAVRDENSNGNTPLLPKHKKSLKSGKNGVDKHGIIVVGADSTDYHYLLEKGLTLIVNKCKCNSCKQALTDELTVMKEVNQIRKAVDESFGPKENNPNTDLEGVTI